MLRFQDAKTTTATTTKKPKTNSQSNLKKVSRHRGRRHTHAPRSYSFIPVGHTAAQQWMDRKRETERSRFKKKIIISRMLDIVWLFSEDIFNFSKKCKKAGAMALPSPLFVRSQICLRNLNFICRVLKWN